MFESLLVVEMVSLLDSTTRFGFPDQDSADVAYVQAILELSFG